MIYEALIEYSEKIVDGIKMLVAKYPVEDTYAEISVMDRQYPTEKYYDTHNRSPKEYLRDSVLQLLPKYIQQYKELAKKDKTIV